MEQSLQESNFDTEYILRNKWEREHGLPETPRNNCKGYTITIPIKDEDGNVLFNKYRHLIGDTKYSYDTGSHASLYGVHRKEFKDAGYVILTEGEAQVIELGLLGFSALSSTGGCVSWKDEWDDKITGRAVYIAYDNDIAGYRGAWKLIKRFPNSRLIVIPSGKDLSEYLFLFSTEERQKVVEHLISGSFNIPQETQELKKLRNEKGDIYNLPYINAFISLAEEEKKVYKPKKPNKKFSDEWRNYPLEKYLKFNTVGFATCPFHNEKTPSLHKIPGANLAHCFGCGKTYGVADVVMQLYGMTFKQAVEEIEKNMTV